MPPSPKLSIGPARRRVQGDELIARRHVDDALVVAALPEREAAARELARRFLAARAFVQAVDPELLAGRGVERRDGAARAARRVQHAVDDERRALETRLRRRAQVRDAEAPRDLERAEVARVDLIERRVTRVAEIAAVGAAIRRCRYLRRATARKRRWLQGSTEE